MAYKAAIRLTIDYEPTVSPDAVLKRWNGAQWVKALLKTYLAGTWQNKPMKVWTGSQWRDVDVSGV